MRYVIAGFGKFGRIALERLSCSFQQPHIVIVESKKEDKLPQLPQHVQFVQDDVISFLGDSSRVQPDDIVVPMVPFHLLAAYVRAIHPGCREIPLPEELLTLVPNPFRIDSSTLCCSRADFICPDDCPEGTVCTVTGEQRESLYRAVEQIRVTGFAMLAQRSFQILPGVGGYRMKQLTELAGRVVEGRYLVATSCKCHAILTALNA